MTETIRVEIIIVFIMVSVGVVFLEHLRTRRMMQRLDAMLWRAINGTFVEETLDETMYSALENKLGRYLADSELSAKNVAKEKDKIKTLIADISHQTKTPVANLLLYAELLQEENLSEQAAQYAECMREQADKLNFLVTSLVKMSRLETGIVNLAPVNNSVSSMLEYLYQNLLPRAEKKGFQLAIENQEAIACFDEKWTTEALHNIVDNAIKYTQAGSVIIRVKEYEMFVCIQVEDTGIGIAEEEQAKIFGRFYRSKDVHQEEGVGIGLYLARQIISGEGGYIKVSSRKGKGSVFEVFLVRKNPQRHQRNVSNA
ncbi:MAG: HAMP domain-containing histidine kinase [Lachnospiraceae bacterium]|nr:HAMP domain-containing histidine kinase [Lachnospiraceae bacterium]